jgi:hypothetical protein
VAEIRGGDRQFEQRRCFTALRVVTEALVQYQWQQEDAIAYTKSFCMGQMAQAETISL